MACPICLDEEATNGLHNALPPARKIVCVRCGTFGISQETIEDAESLNNTDRWRISAWICEYSPQILKSEDIEQALVAKVPGFCIGQTVCWQRLASGIQLDTVSPRQMSTPN